MCSRGARRYSVQLLGPIREAVSAISAYSCVGLHRLRAVLVATPPPPAAWTPQPPAYPPPSRPSELAGLYVVVERELRPGRLSLFAALGALGRTALDLRKCAGGSLAGFGIARRSCGRPAGGSLLSAAEKR